MTSRTARGTRRLVLVGIASLTGLTTAQAGCAQSAVPRCGCESRTVAASVMEERIGLPFFDSAGRLQWNSSRAGSPGRMQCGPGDPATWRRTWVLEPRVEELQCQEGARRLLVGLDAAGEERWRRPLAFLSGERRLDEWVIGSDPSAIVLSDLAVVSPATGEALFPAPSHPVPGEDRAVPNHSFQGAALFLASERIFLLFIASDSSDDRRGGLYRFDPVTGKKDLLLPMASNAFGGSWVVEDLKLDPDGRHLYIAQRLAVRGPGAVAFAVYDLTERRLLCRETVAEGRYTKEPRLVVGGHRLAGLSYRDEAAREIALMAYRLRK